MTQIIDILVILFAFGIFALLFTFCKRFFKGWKIRVSVDWSWHNWFIGIGIYLPWGVLGFGGSINLGPFALIVNFYRRRDG